MYAKNFIKMTTDKLLPCSSCYGIFYVPLTTEAPVAVPFQCNRLTCKHNSECCLLSSTPQEAQPLTLFWAEQVILFSGGNLWSLQLFDAKALVFLPHAFKPLTYPPQGKHISIKMHSRGGHPIEQESLVSVNKQMVSHAPLLLVKLKHSKIIHPALSSNWAHYLCQTRTNCRMEGKTDPRTALPMPVMRIYRSQGPTAAHKVQITPEELSPSKDER